jgi:hypothetical protein
MNLDTMTRSELEVLELQKRNEYQLALDALETIELQDLDIAKKLAELQMSRKNLSTGLTQGKYAVRRIALELKNINTYLWKRRQGE